MFNEMQIAIMQHENPDCNVDVDIYGMRGDAHLVLPNRKKKYYSDDAVKQAVERCYCAATDEQLLKLFTAELKRRVREDELVTREQLLTACCFRVPAVDAIDDGQVQVLHWHFSVFIHWPPLMLLNQQLEQATTAKMLLQVLIFHPVKVFAVDLQRGGQHNRSLFTREPLLSATSIANIHANGALLPPPTPVRPPRVSFFFSNRGVANAAHGWHDGRVWAQTRVFYEQTPLDVLKERLFETYELDAAFSERAEVLQWNVVDVPCEDNGIKWTSIAVICWDARLLHQNMHPEAGETMNMIRCCQCGPYAYLQWASEDLVLQLHTAAAVFKKIPAVISARCFTKLEKAPLFQLKNINAD